MQNDHIDCNSIPHMLPMTLLVEVMLLIRPVMRPGVWQVPDGFSLSTDPSTLLYSKCLPGNARRSLPCSNYRVVHQATLYRKTSEKTVEIERVTAYQKWNSMVDSYQLI